MASEHRLRGSHPLVALSLALAATFGGGASLADPPRANRNSGSHSASASHSRGGAHSSGHRGSSHQSSSRRHRTSRSRHRVNLAAYRAHVRAWHDASRVPAARFTEDGRLTLRVVSINSRTSAEVTPLRREGGFDQASYQRVSEVLGDHRTHTSTGIDPRLIDLMYQLAAHFRAGQISVISGYRANAGRSNHARGRAVDLILPGVDDETLAAHARTLGFVGVGVYLRGGFVHLDVRERSYFWVDSSAPGRRSRRMREMHGADARQADQAARARGVTPFGAAPQGEGATPAETPEDEENAGETAVAPGG